MSKDYVVEVISKEGVLDLYKQIKADTEERAVEIAIERFRSEHPGKDIEQDIAHEAKSYFADSFDAHYCKDDAGRGCCEICGGIIYGSPLYKDICGWD